MIRHFASRQFAVFLLAGGTAALANWLARIVLSRWFTFPIAVLLAYCAGMAVAFVLNRAFVFPGSPRPVALQVRDFVLVNLASAPLVWGSAVALDRALAWAGLDTGRQELAHGIAVTLPALASFLAHKFITFRERKPAQ